jgi:hypothetical protein
MEEEEEALAEAEGKAEAEAACEAAAEAEAAADSEGVGEAAADLDAEAEAVGVDVGTGLQKALADTVQAVAKKATGQLSCAAVEQGVQPELELALAKVTPGMQGTQAPAAAADEKPAAQAEHSASPELAKVPAAHAVQVRLLLFVVCAYPAVHWHCPVDTLKALLA